MPLAKNKTRHSEGLFVLTAWSETPTQTTLRESSAANSTLRRTIFKKGRSPRICLGTISAPNHLKIQILEMTRFIYLAKG